ncbi:hypothetical protein [Glycomyces rhizosphaerae]|uniref:Uncharacterized protein n=1 Tax=Glycomyces rhizosphaerae TaxID=2054422 RepID=A0ABV7Q5T6_9ACTN
MGQPQFAGPPPMLPPRPPSDRPSPVGLAVAGVGLALLCISMLLPRIKIDDPDGEFSYYSFAGAFGAFGASGYGIDTSIVVLSVALLAAVGLSAHRSPALRWPSRLGAIGTAALLAAFTYHPVTVLRQAMDSFESLDEYEDYEDGASSTVSQIDITADSGVYIATVAALLLAVSAFLMQANTRRNEQFPASPHMQPPPPGNNPTVSVSPG